MKIAHLTAGTGSFHCGNCHRDAALVKGLRELGHEAFLVPLYLPLVLDDEADAPKAPLFAGGVNMYLQQKVGLFRYTPRWLDKLFDATGLLRYVSRYAGMTQAKDLGEMTVEAFRGLESRQAKEWERLLVFLKAEKPDVVALSNGLLAGLARPIKEQLGCRVIATLQGEDSFLDTLPEPWKTQAWEALSQCDAFVDRWVAVSDYYRDLMAQRMKLPAGRIVRVWNGTDLADLSPAPAPPDIPTIGYLARFHHGKGLHTLVDAFILLKNRGNLPQLRLRLGGTMQPTDEPYVQALKQKLAHADLSSDVEFLPNIPGPEKGDFLRSLSVLSVPAMYGEAFGLFVIEAWACGVPVVQPHHAAFPELIEATGAGALCSGDDPSSLAVTLEQLLLTPGLAPTCGQRGREAVLEHFTAQAMARGFAEVCG